MSPVKDVPTPPREELAFTGLLSPQKTRSDRICELVSEAIREGIEKIIKARAEETKEQAANHSSRETRMQLLRRHHREIEADGCGFIVRSARQASVLLEKIPRGAFVLYPSSSEREIIRLFQYTIMGTRGELLYYNLHRERFIEDFRGLKNRDHYVRRFLHPFLVECLKCDPANPYEDLYGRGASGHVARLFRKAPGLHLPYLQAHSIQFLQEIESQFIPIEQRLEAFRLIKEKVLLQKTQFIEKVNKLIVSWNLSLPPLDPDQNFVLLNKEIKQVLMRVHPDKRKREESIPEEAFSLLRQEWIEFQTCITIMLRPMIFIETSTTGLHEAALRRIDLEFTEFDISSQK